jgi:hypothetical protein
VATVAPYNPARIVGSTIPTAAAPPAQSNGGCGGIGEIIVAIVAVAVTVLTEGATAPELGELLGSDAAGAAAAGAIGGAAGSVVSQGVGIALGVQSGFSFADVALGALGGTVGGAVNGVEVPDAAAPGGLSVQGGIAAFQSGLPGAIEGAALASAATQGVAVSVGLQKSFSWAAVAGAAVGAGVGGEAGQDRGTIGGSTLAGQLVAGTAGGLAGGITAAALEGGRINPGQIAADAFGNALGNAIASEIEATPPQAPQPAFVGSQGAGLSGPSFQYQPPSALSPIGVEPLAPLAGFTGDGLPFEADNILQAAPAAGTAVPSFTDGGFLNPQFSNPALQSLNAGYGSFLAGTNGLASDAASLSAGPATVSSAGPTEAVNGVGGVAQPSPVELGNAAIASARAQDQAFYTQQIGDAQAVGNNLTAGAYAVGAVLNNFGYNIAQTALNAYAVATDPISYANFKDNLAASLNNPNIPETIGLDTVVGAGYGIHTIHLTKLAGPMKSPPQADQSAT